MFYVGSKTASIVFNVGQSTLRESVSRNSNRYPFLRIENTGKRGRGGARLLFKIEIAQLKMALHSKKISNDTKIYTLDKGGLKEISLGDIFGDDFIQNLGSGVVNGGVSGADSHSDGVAGVSGVNDYDRASYVNGGVDKASGFDSHSDGVAGVSGFDTHSDGGVYSCDKINNKRRILDNKNGYQGIGGKNKKEIKSSEISSGDGELDSHITRNESKMSDDEKQHIASLNLTKDLKSGVLGGVVNDAKESKSGLCGSSTKGGLCGVGSDVSVLGGVSNNSSILGGDNSKNSKADSHSHNSALCGNAKNVTYFQLSDKQKDEVNEKIKLIKEQISSGQSVADFCKARNLSKSTFYRWKKEYKNGGAVGLADKSGMHRKGESKLEPWMQEFVLSKFRAYGAGNFNLTECVDSLNAEIIKRDGLKYGLNLSGEFSFCDSGVIKRFLDNHYKNKPLEYTVITKGFDKAKSYFKPSMGDQREIFTFRNQCWQIDSSPLDMIVRDDETNEPFRPHILSIVDVYSGRGVVSLEKTSNSLNIIRLLWKAISTLGKPQTIKGDNGKDYLSGNFQELLNGLGIFYEAALPYSGEQKGMVERRFKTLQHSGIAMLPGYIGNDLKTREQIEQRTPKKDRHAKDEYGHSKMTNLKNLLSFSQAKKELEILNMKWDLISGKRRKGKPSPMDIWNSDDTKLLSVDYAEFLLYASKGVDRVVTKKGINFNGDVFVSFDMPPVKTRVTIRQNIDDVSEIYVFSQKGEFLCVARDSKKANLSADELKIVNKSFKKDLSEIKKVIDKASQSLKRDALYELENIKKLHRKSLKAEKWELSNDISSVKEKIQTSKKLNEISNQAANYEKYRLKKDETKTKKFKGFDELIEDVS
ncbi:IS66 family insertion sequence element accessory protein TnpA [Campylobacter corcagiensis]|uniref:DDE-type integrase/transposase/recombinase n=1 Tax=Campylobacter corcagiensis TaxID=1448857 RepID=A0A7M1LF88_9BACT|nr:DDE-type integrase/transposase/recombinase [Campylobacter corcagiensis]QKF64580.1 bacteriophage DNA transposition protein A [Campylobacter corcagiensis]QOQ87247.1 DDE-type integrase/transposase/recombinase [Campylobacter corcagiensis]